jgi:hypothetical protein
LVNQEFYNQAVKESEYGLTPSHPLVSCKAIFYSGEMKYIQFVCLPYWEALIELLPELGNELEKIYQNLHIFSDKHDELVRKSSEFQVEHYS